MTIVPFSKSIRMFYNTNIQICITTYKVFICEVYMCILLAAAFIHLPCFNLLSQYLTAWRARDDLVFQLRGGACCSSSASSINEAQASCSACFEKEHAANKRSTKFVINDTYTDG